MAREFKSGAYRDGEDGKNDYEGFLCPLVIKGYGDYMTKHRLQSNGEYRDSDNWQRGIPKDAYVKSMWRHFHDLWMEHRGYKSREGLDEAMYGLLFNVMGYIHETEKENLTLELTEKGKKEVEKFEKTTGLDNDWQTPFNEITKGITRFDMDKSCVCEPDDICLH